MISIPITCPLSLVSIKVTLKVITAINHIW
nr:MAG TPA: hypothetical protein [Caudoviricetes sp.]